MKVFFKVNTFLLAFCLFFFLIYCASDLRLNITASMPKGIYRITVKEPERGSQVEVCLEGEFASLALERGYLRNGRCESGIMPLVKAFVGLPGDEVVLNDAGVYINGNLYPKSEIRAFDSQGRVLISQLESGVIPLNKALVLSEHEGGFDGRYFGLVDIEGLSRVKPVLIFKE